MSPAEGGQRPRRGTPRRTKARRRAVELLFEADLRRIQPGQLAAERLTGGQAEPAAQASGSVKPDQTRDDYAGAIVRGVDEHQAEIDETLATYTLGWTLERMPAIDRAIARAGAWELMFGQVPAGVVLGEAADLAAQFSTDNSPDFISGLLGRVADLHAGA